jgi:hypothetical protein
VSAHPRGRTRAAERVYRLLLRAYPAAFRAAYGREMVLAFRDQRRETGASGVRFWAAVVWDVARSAPALRVEALRARGEKGSRTEEGTMKPMAILAVLIGALEVVNAAAEGWVGWTTYRDGYSLAGGVMGAVAGALLVASGIALLRRSPGAAAWARGAASTCLVMFLVIGLVTPRLSILALLLGIGFPLALLLFLRWSRGRSVPTMA